MKEDELINRLEQSIELLAPMIRGRVTKQAAQAKYDLEVEGMSRELPDATFRFAVEVKTQSTPRAVHGAIGQIKAFTEGPDGGDFLPMILVPHLSEDRLRELEAADVSGIDLCGNGIITVPGRLLIYRTGKPNAYPDSRKVASPFRGKSALVARAFLGETVYRGDAHFDTLNELRDSIEKRGGDISLSQVSKAASALEEERIIGSQGRSIYLLEPDQILDQLAANWRPEIRRRAFLRIPDRKKVLPRLNNVPDLSWTVSGSCSVTTHVPFSQAGPVQVVVDDLSKALDSLGGTPEPVPSYADLEILESLDPGYYFDTKMGKDGIRWAGPLQAWAELMNGDARQQEAAKDIRDQLIVKPSTPLIDER